MANKIKYIAKDNGIVRYNGISDVTYEDNKIKIGLDTSINEKYLLEVNMNDSLMVLVGNESKVNVNYYRMQFSEQIVSAVEALFNEADELVFSGREVQNAITTAIYEQLNAYNIVF